MMAGGRHRRNWKKYSSSGIRSHKSDQRIVKRSILFTFVERWNVCQEVIGLLAVFHFPSSFSLFEIEDHAALSSCVCVSWKGGIDTERKKRNVFFLLTFTRRVSFARFRNRPLFHRVTSLFGLFAFDDFKLSRPRFIQLLLFEFFFILSFWCVTFNRIIS